MKLRVFIAAALLFGAAACTAPPTGGNNPVVVGDSIVFGAQMQGAFNSMPNAFFNAQPGRGMYRKGILVAPDGSWHAGTSGAEAIPLVLTKLVPTGGWTVIELGSNDLDLPYYDDEASISELMRLVPGCLAWVNVWNNANDNTRLRSRQFNVALVNAASKRNASCTRIINWAGEAEIHAYDYLSDGLHTTPLGSMKLAQLIRSVTG